MHRFMQCSGTKRRQPHQTRYPIQRTAFRIVELDTVQRGEDERLVYARGALAVEMCRWMFSSKEEEEDS